MNLVLFGGSGQVGHELIQLLPNIGDVRILTRAEADFSTPQKIKEITLALNADVIVNAAAYTAVDKAEQEPDLADRVNHRSVRSLAEAAEALNSHLLHYSTDFVFDGKKTEPYTEEDDVNPLSVYGRTKLDGEQAIINSKCKYTIIRTSWVYSHHRVNFVKTILRLARERKELRVVDDQKGIPTCARQIAQATSSLIEQKEFTKTPQATFHLAAAGVATWFELAKATVSIALKYGIELENNCIIIAEEI